MFNKTFEHRSLSLRRGIDGNPSRPLHGAENELDRCCRAYHRRERARGSEEAIDGLLRLTLAYLEFAARHTIRWRALFEHRMSEGRPLPEWFVDQQQVLFLQVERPLLTLLPELDEAARRTLARTLFSAVHGIVALGLEEKLVSLPLPDLRSQLTAAVRAIATGREQLRSIAF